MSQQPTKKCLRRQARNGSENEQTMRLMNMKACFLSTSCSRPGVSAYLQYLNIHKQNGRSQEVPLKAGINSACCPFLLSYHDSNNNDTNAHLGCHNYHLQHNALIFTQTAHTLDKSTVVAISRKTRRLTLPCEESPSM